MTHGWADMLVHYFGNQHCQPMLLAVQETWHMTDEKYVSIHFWYFLTPKVYDLDNGNGQCFGEP